MPQIPCKEKIGEAGACKKNIVYLGKPITALSGGAEVSKNKKDDALQPITKILTLKCIDGHVYNYEITFPK